ncbi:hypothetical protein [Aquitalea pelogenes]|nr:hypothetical protein [Aquitalea pelogenes]
MTESVLLLAGASLFLAGVEKLISMEILPGKVLSWRLVLPRD